MVETKTLEDERAKDVSKWVRGEMTSVSQSFSLCANTSFPYAALFSRSICFDVCLFPVSLPSDNRFDHTPSKVRLSLSPI